MWRFFASVSSALVSNSFFFLGYSLSSTPVSIFLTFSKPVLFCCLATSNVSILVPHLQCNFLGDKRFWFYTVRVCGFCFVLTGFHLFSSPTFKEKLIAGVIWLSSMWPVIIDFIHSRCLITHSLWANIMSPFFVTSYLPYIKNWFPVALVMPLFKHSFYTRRTQQIWTNSKHLESRHKSVCLCRFKRLWAQQKKAANTLLNRQPLPCSRSNLVSAVLEKVGKRGYWQKWKRSTLVLGFWGFKGLKKVRAVKDSCNYITFPPHCSFWGSLTALALQISFS